MIGDTGRGMRVAGYKNYLLTWDLNIKLNELGSKINRFIQTVSKSHLSVKEQVENMRMINKILFFLSSRIPYRESRISHLGSFPIIPLKGYCIYLYHIYI